MQHGATAGPCCSVLNLSGCHRHLPHRPSPVFRSKFGCRTRSVEDTSADAHWIERTLRNLLAWLHGLASLQASHTPHPDAWQQLHSSNPPPQHARHVNCAHIRLN